MVDFFLSPYDAREGGGLKWCVARISQSLGKVLVHTSV